MVVNQAQFTSNIIFFAYPPGMIDIGTRNYMVIAELYDLGAQELLNSDVIYSVSVTDPCFDNINFVPSDPRIAEQHYTIGKAALKV